MRPERDERGGALAHLHPKPQRRDDPRHTDVKRLTIWLLLATALAQAAFASLPQIDLWVSGLFYDPEHGFALRENALLREFRYALIWAVWVVGIPAFWLAIVSRWGRGPYRIGPRPWTYAAAGLILGPGLLVNGIFKSLWGRARPADVTEFGGAHDFSPPFQIVGECARNCSFTSGEAASITALVLVALVLGWPRTSHLQRLALAAVLAPIALAGSALRVVTGRHFLSDVLFSALFCMLILVWLYRVLQMHRYPGMTPRDLVADLATALRDTFRPLAFWRRTSTPPPEQRVNET